MSPNVLLFLSQGFEDLEAAAVIDVCGWTAFEYSAASAYAGQTITLAFDGVANGTYPTSYVIDTLALEAYACQ